VDIVDYNCHAAFGGKTEYWENARHHRVHVWNYVGNHYEKYNKYNDKQEGFL
jgi:hypothetical protein